MRRFNLMCLAAVLLCVLAFGAGAADVDPTKGTSLPATWEYSTDGGKPFSPDPPMGVRTRVPDAKYTVVARTTFTIVDPSKIGRLKVLTHGQQGALVLSDVETVDRRNVGTAPNLTRTKIVLNGKAIDAGRAPFSLYRWRSAASVCSTSVSSRLRTGACPPLRWGGGLGGPQAGLAAVKSIAETRAASDAQHDCIFARWILRESV